MHILRPIRAMFLCIFAVANKEYKDFLNLTEISPDTLIDVYDFACGQHAFCNKSLSRYVGLDYNCITCESCHCDESCEKHGDCCADVALSHAGQKQRMTNSRCVNANPKECVKRGDFFPGGQYYRIVDRCPALYPNNSIQQRCESDNLTDYDVALPVTSKSSNLTYRNKFCAECHDVVDAIQWTATLYCKDTIPMRGLSTQSEIWHSVMAKESCCIASVREPKNAYVRQCYEMSNISACPDKTNATKFDNFLAQQCQSFSAEVYVVLEKTTYRNIFCAACHGVPIVRDGTGRCQRIRNFGLGLHTASLGVLINFNPKPKVPQAEEIVCPNNEVFDPLLNRCRKVSCPPYKRLENDTCINTYRSMKGLTYQLKYFLIPSQPSIAPPFTLAHNYSTSLLQLVKTRNVIIISRVSPFGTNISIVQTNYLEVYLAISATTEMPENHFRDFLTKYVLRSWIDSDGVTYTTHHNDKCPKNLSLPENISNLRDISSAAKVTQLSPPKEDIGAPNKWLSEQCRKNCLPSTDRAEYFGRSLRNSCPFVSYKTNEVVIDRQRGVLSKGERSLQVKEDEYEICGDELYVCMNTLQENGLSQNTTGFSEYGLQVASVVATSLSLAGLALTFLTFGLFSELRTLSGINTMSLVANLFIAQLLFQATSRAANHSFTLCAVFGILVHYFWLSSFFWMVVIAYYIFNVFREVRLTNAQGHVHKFLRYAAFANGTPILVIVACIAKNVVVTSREYIGYGYDLCFITNGIDVGIFMVAPLGVIIVINATFFGLTIHSIRSTTATIDTNLGKERRHIGIYIKLSVLLGFMWVFGLLAAALNVEALWYLFIVTSGCNGVFIFVAYCCTRRILNLYQALCCVVKDTRSTSTPVLTPSNKI